MFTELIRKGKWSYMLLTVVAVIAVAVLAALANTHTQDEPNRTVGHEQGKAVYGSYTRYNGTTMHFVN